MHEYVKANCDYPGQWRGEIERSEINENGFITVVKVCPKEGTASFHAVSFAQLKNGKIKALDEYWSDDGEVPEWRQQLHIGKPIN